MSFLSRPKLTAARSGAHRLLPLIPGLMLALAAHAQVTYTGTTAAQNLGSQHVGISGTAVSFPFSIAAGTTVGSIAVLTQGAPNLDFNAAGGTCAAQTYSSQTTCQVKVTFTPVSPGPRFGAVVFFSASGNNGTLLGKVLLTGLGTAAVSGFNPSPPATVAVSQSQNIYEPGVMALDGAGDLFVGEGSGVYEIPAAGGAAREIDPTINVSQVGDVAGVAVDGAGNLFFSDTAYNLVVEMPVGGGAPVVFAPTADGLPLHFPQALAVDGVGDLFIADYWNSRVVEMPAGGGAPVAIAPDADEVALKHIEYLAIDGAGDLFIADSSNNRVVEVPADGGAAVAIDPVANGAGLKTPFGVAIGWSGELFIADGSNNRVVEVPADGGPSVAFDPTVGGAALNEPADVLIDGSGNLLIADARNSRVLRVARTQPPALSYPTPTAVDATDTADGTQTVHVSDIGNEPLVFSSLIYPADFSPAPGDSAACTASTILSPGQSCDLPIQFTPKTAGLPLTEAVTLTTNALNGGGQQSIAVTGTSTAILTSPAPGSTLPGSSATFSWSSIPAPAEYALRVGTGLGGDNLYQSPTLTATSQTVTGLPLLGQKVYVRLSAKINGIWQYQDYLYYEAGTVVQAQLTSPAPGAIIGPSTTFTWSSGTAVAEYFFQLGSKGPGTYDVFNTGATTALSATVSYLPGYGQKLYARLGSKINGMWQSEDYTFTTYTLAGITTPTPETTLGGSTVTFDWTTGSGPTEYALRIGTGQGANNLYQSPNLTGTSLTVTGIPTTGATIWVRLNSKVNGTWLYQDYNYTEE